MEASPSFYVKAQENIDLLQVFAKKPQPPRQEDP
jgi:hypothetical protein